MWTISQRGLLVTLFLLMVPPAFAHRPYEVRAGHFKREDGTVITIVRHYVDGIFFADPASVQFRLPNGTTVAQTRHVPDSIIRVIPFGVEVYQYQGRWVPVADRVDRFDGQALHEVTHHKRVASFFAHVSGHWIGYLVSTALGIFLLWVRYALRTVPKEGWHRVLRWAGSAIFGFLAFIWVFDILFFESLSPLILALIAVTVWAICKLVKEKFRGRRLGV